MNIPDLLKLSLHNLKTNKRRSFLTMLGLIIGILSVILVLSVGAGAQSLITNQFQKQGTDKIGVLAGASDPQGPPASAMGIIITTLTEDDALSLLNKRNVTHVQSVNAYISGNDVLQWRDVDRNVTFTGTLASYAPFEKVELASGRFFTDGEGENGEHVIVLGSDIAETIFGNTDAVGETVKLKRKSFKVIGVLKHKGSTGFENPDNAVLLPLKTAQRDLLGVNHITYLRAQLDDPSTVEQSMEEVRQTLIERHGDEDFSVRSVADLLQTLTTVTNVIKFFLVAIAGIALFVGGIGIMNIMLIAVKEKTREIGLRKAVGATKRDISLQFLAESIFIAMLAGLIGIILGVVISYVIAKGVQFAGYDYSFIISFGSIITACFVSGLTGLVFGTLPARKAGVLDPIEALRYE